jgi:hypothetical protein
MYKFVMKTVFVMIINLFIAFCILVFMLGKYTLFFNELLDLESM